MAGSVPIDDETYGDRREHSRAARGNGNPGRPQSEFERPDVDADVAPVESVEDAPYPYEKRIPRDESSASDTE
ncbi:MAG: hypothetical protein JO147_06625 [Actinobacteria bacterium]|nr:hypothetical protein [Actinomycetota bacterium]